MQDKKGNSPIIVSSHDVHLDSDYVQWIHDIKERFRGAQIKAAVKVNSEQLLFNWQLGRDLVLRKSEEKWGRGIVEQLSLDLQHEFPEVKGFSARNLWNMKKWYSFYALAEDSDDLIQAVDNKFNFGSAKLQQIGAEIKQGKLRFLLLHIEETAFYQLLKPLYQVQNLSNLKKKTKGKKSLPIKRLVTQRRSSPQPRINPAFRQKVRKADGNVSPETLKFNMI